MTGALATVVLDAHEIIVFRNANMGLEIMKLGFDNFTQFSIDVMLC
jgi:hypothetical protein